MNPVRLETMPGLPGAYLDAALRPRRRRLPPGDTLPDTRIEVVGAQLDTGAIAAYAEICAYEEIQIIPITYPFILMFPLQLALVTRPEWRLRTPGLVHLGITLTQHSALPADARLDLCCHAGNESHTERGLEFDIALEVSDSAGQLLWTARNRILSRDPAQRRMYARRNAETQDPQAPGLVATGRFTAPADTGRRYARVSGDWNPIHLGWLGARMFGFRRPIAHGMWTLARTLAVAGFGAGTPGRVVQAEFRSPLYLPGTAAVWVGDGAFAARDAESGRLILQGEVNQSPD